MKICSKCKVSQDESEFCKNKSRKDGLNYQCKTCRKQCRADNKEYHTEYNKKYRADNKEYHTEYDKKYRADNKEVIAERGKQYRADNKEVIAERHKQYRSENGEAIAEKRKQYYTENKEFIAEQMKQYRAENKAKHNAFNAKRRASKRNQTPELTDLEKEAIVWYYEVSRKLGPDWHVDHIKPLSKGGLHHPDNLQVIPATENMKKHNNEDYHIPKHLCVRM